MRPPRPRHQRDDRREFVPSDKGKPLKGWPGEWWLNIKSDNVKRIMTKVRGHGRQLTLPRCAGIWPHSTAQRTQARKGRPTPHCPEYARSPRNARTQRMQACKDRGFLGVDPDNVDGYQNKARASFHTLVHALDRAPAVCAPAPATPASRAHKTGAV